MTHFPNYHQTEIETNYYHALSIEQLMDYYASDESVPVTNLEKEVTQLKRAHQLLNGLGF